MIITYSLVCKYYILSSQTVVKKLRSSGRIRKAAVELARHSPYDKITFADVAKEAGVHWTTVKRYFGNREEMRSMLREIQIRSAESLADTRSRILQSARNVFSTYGYENATLDLVAEDAGLTKGAIYWHFAGKSELFLALMDQSLKNLLEGLFSQAQDVFASPDPMEALRILLESEFKSCEGDRGKNPMLFFEFISRSREPAVKKKLSHSFSELLDGTSKILAELQQQERINSNLKAHEISVSLHALMNGVILMWLVAPERISFESLSAEISKMLWRGLQP